MRRPWRAIRPGMTSSRRRSVACACGVVWPRPRICVQRARLAASAAITHQAAFAEVVAAGQVTQGAVFVVSDRELDDGVLSMLVLDEGELVGAVGEEGVVSPVGPERRLLTDKPRAPHDQAPLAELCFGDLGDARRRVVGERLPRCLVDLGDRGAHVCLQGDADRVGDLVSLECRDRLVRPEARVGAYQDLAENAGAAQARDELIDETLRATLRVGGAQP
jgi:hypothetical protein